MAGLVPAIHVFADAKKDVDARAKPGHDEYVAYGRKFRWMRMNTVHTL